MNGLGRHLRALATILKASNENVMDRAGFERMTDALAAALEDAAEAPEAKALAAVLRASKNDWEEMTGAERTAAVRRVEQVFADAGASIGDAAAKELEGRGGRIAQEARKVMVGEHRLPVTPTLDLVDRRVIDHAASSQALFVTDEYKRRGNAASELARGIVAAGLEQGLDSREIGKDLEREIGGMARGRTASYWPMLASVFAARSRTFGTLTSFSDAGIEYAEWQCVLDEVSCNACRFMHGRVFPVAGALQRYRDVADAEDPEAVRDLQPFLQIAKDEDGREGIFAGRGEGRAPLGFVTRSGVGTKDDAGEFSHAASGEKMGEMGVTNPPAHPRCRCLLLPVFDAPKGASSSVSEQVGAPAEEAPAARPLVRYTPHDARLDVVPSVPNPGKVIDAATDAVFPDGAPSIHELETAWSGPGVDAAVDQILTTSQGAQAGQQLKFHGTLRAESGEEVGSLVRTFGVDDEGQRFVKHDYFALKQGAQGSGVATAMMKQSIELYRKLGVKYVSVDAEYIGKYAWATKGYDWADASGAELASVAFQSFAKKHGLELTDAEADLIAQHPWDLAAFDNGKTVTVSYHDADDVKQTGEFALGKAFMLQGPSWSGKLSLEEGSASLAFATKKLARSTEESASVQRPAQVIPVIPERFSEWKEDANWRASYKELSRSAEKLVTAEQRKAIDDFTREGYGAIRAAEFDAKTAAAADIQRSSAITDAIEAFKSAHPDASFNVMRGVGALTKEALESAMSVYQQSEPWGFGKPHGALGGASGATTSTSMRLNAADAYATGACAKWGGEYKILYRVKSTGLPVGELSSAEGEAEVILSKTARYQTDKVFWKDETHTTLMVEAHEVTLQMPIIAHPAAAPIAPEPAFRLDALPSIKKQDYVANEPTISEERAYVSGHKATLSSLSEAELEAATRFTYGYDFAIRGVQRGIPDEKLEELVAEFRRTDRRGVEAPPDTPKEHVAAAKVYAKGIDSAFLKSANSPVEARVFRGMNNLSQETVEKMLADGFIEMSCASSASRSQGVALEYFDGAAHGKYKVVMDIQQSHGLGVEDISEFGYEREVLLPKGRRYEIVSAETIKGKADQIYLRMRELPLPGDGASAVAKAGMTVADDIAEQEASVGKKPSPRAIRYKRFTGNGAEVEELADGTMRFS